MGFAQARFLCHARGQFKRPCRSRCEANPEPDDLGPVKLTEGAIAEANPGGVAVVLFIDLPEVKLRPGWEGLRRNN